MAQKASELNKINNIDNQDPIAITAGAARETYVEKYPEDYAPSEAERNELASNTGERPPETEHIKAQIEETRHQMGGTIDAIQERLSFSNISDQVSEHVSNAIETAKDTVYEATIGKAVSFMKNMGDGISENSMVKTAKHNPFPIALIGIGAGLLAYNIMKPRQHQSFDGRREWSPDRTYPQPVEDNKSMLTSAQEKLSGVTDTVSSAAGTAYDNVTNTVTNAYSTAGDAAQKAYDKAGELGHYTQDQYEHYMAENPLAVGAIALAVGAAVGLAIPSTRYEGELMGDTRDQLLQKAQETATTYIDKAKQVASEAGHKIDNEVKTLAG
jgi:Protein of unknown function (DUF3618).